MRIVKRHAGGPENQVIIFFRPYVMDSKNTVSILEIKGFIDIQYIWTCIQCQSNGFVHLIVLF